MMSAELNLSGFNSECDELYYFIFDLSIITCVDSF